MHQFIRSTINRGLIGAAVLAVPFVATEAATSVVSSQQFDSASLSAATGWALGAQSGGAVTVSTDTTKNYNGSTGSLKGSYPTASGGVYVWGAYDVSALKTEDLYIDFWAKMPTAKQGLKFLKIFGGNAGGNTSNYANTTFQLDYGGGGDLGQMYQVSFADGTNIGNDNANVINFDGTYPNWIGRSYGTATVLTPQKKSWASSNWGTSWHHFRFHVKFNSGTSQATEVADGAYYVEIDGVVYVDAKGLFNRHYSNAPIDRVELFGWAQNGSAPFEIWYDNVKITTGGFDTGAVAPNPPGSFKVSVP